jgi:hypothetical protein
LYNAKGQLLVLHQRDCAAVRVERRAHACQRSAQPFVQVSRPGQRCHDDSDNLQIRGLFSLGGGLLFGRGG